MNCADPALVIATARNWLGTPYHDQASLEAGPGTLILFRMAPRAIAKHVGILTGPDRFIHAYERLGVVEETLTTAWARKISFAFQFPHPSSI